MQRYLAQLADGEWHEWDSDADRYLMSALRGLETRGLANIHINSTTSKIMAIATDAGLPLAEGLAKVQQSEPFQ